MYAKARPLTDLLSSHIIVTLTGGLTDCCHEYQTPPATAGFHFPSALISRTTWLYHGFCLSVREAEERLADRSITVTDETIRQWWWRFGPAYARNLRTHPGRLDDTCHLNEVLVTIQGQRQFLWPMMDQDEDIIDILVQLGRQVLQAFRDRFSRSQAFQFWKKFASAYQVRFRPGAYALFPSRPATLTIPTIYHLAINLKLVADNQTP